MQYEYSGTVTEVTRALLDDIEANGTSDDPIVLESRNALNEGNTDRLVKEILEYLGGIVWGMDGTDVGVVYNDDNTVMVHITSGVFVPGVTYGPWDSDDLYRPQDKGKHASTKTLKMTSMNLEIPAFVLAPDNSYQPVDLEWHKTDGRPPEGLYVTFPDGTRAEFSCVALPASENTGSEFIDQQRQSLIDNNIIVEDGQSEWGEALFIYGNDQDTPTAMFLFAPGVRWCVVCKVLYSEDAMYEERYNDVKDIIESAVVHRGNDAKPTYAAMNLSLIEWEQ